MLGIDVLVALALIGGWRARFARGKVLTSRGDRNFVRLLLFAKEPRVSVKPDEIFFYTVYDHYGLRRISSGGTPTWKCGLQ